MKLRVIDLGSSLGSGSAVVMWSDPDPTSASAWSSEKNHAGVFFFFFKQCVRECVRACVYSSTPETSPTHPSGWI